MTTPDSLYNLVTQSRVGGHMKKLLCSGLAIGLSLVPISVGASHLPNSYCSESGDVCASTNKVDGKRLLRISTAAKYFDTYRVCVTAPDDSRTCRNGEMRDGNGDGIWTGRINWSERFPNEGPGAYNVRWTSGDFQTRRLGFHVPR